MNFEEYQRLHKLSPLEKTEQSWTFVIEENGKRRVVKRYPSEFDRLREELSYSYINHFNLLRVPELFFRGEDFVVMDFLESIGSPSLEESIGGISKLYVTTLNDSKLKAYFPRIDLSKERIMHRLEYLPEELKKRSQVDSQLIGLSKKFVESGYLASPHQCLVHGDLKSPHIIKTEKGVFFFRFGSCKYCKPMV